MPIHLFYSPEKERKIAQNMADESRKYHDLVEQYVECLVDIELQQRELVGLMPDKLKHSKHNKERIDMQRKFKLAEFPPSAHTWDKIIDSTSKKRTKRQIQAVLKDYSDSVKQKETLESQINSLASSLNTQYRDLGRSHRISTTYDLKANRELEHMKYKLKEQKRTNTRARR